MIDRTYYDFEKQIARIHRALTEIDAQVTWNDRIIDPDNPDQERQIDVTISRSNHLTLIECRKHKAPQDVTWVEELYGRRVSLRANSIIGVSASGFTQGAIHKAKSLGVVLRDFDTVTPDEARRWGEPSVLWIVFYEFRNFTVWLDHPNANISIRPKLTDMHGRPLLWRTVLMELTKKYDLNVMAGRFIALNGEVGSALLVDSIAFQKFGFTCRVRGRKREIQAPSVSIYSNPIDQSDVAEARVDHFPLGQTEVIKGPELASMIVDLSGIKVPHRSIFGMAGISQEGGIRIRDVQIVGTNNILESDVAIEVRLRPGLAR